MATKKLAETHDMTLEDADGIMTEIMEATLAVRRVEVVYEEKAQALIDECAEATAGDRARLEELEQRLSAFIERNPGLFKRPRMRVMACGKYGVSTSTRVEITDEAQLLRWLKRHKHTAAIKTEETPIRKAVKKLLKTKGTRVYGARLVEGDNIKMELDPAVLEEL